MGAVRRRRWTAPACCSGTARVKLRLTGGIGPDLVLQRYSAFVHVFLDSAAQAPQRQSVVTPMITAIQRRSPGPAENGWAERRPA
jgi:hypothetical protein